MADASAPTVSVVVVCDRIDSGVRSWADERAMLTALRDQDYCAPFDVLVVDGERWAASVPPDVRAILPSARFLFVDGDSSAPMKDAGVADSSGDWVAVFEADSIPRSDWLRVMVETITRHPDAGAVSSRTLYPGDSMIRRVLALFHRGIVDEGREGRTRHFNNNGAFFRRDEYLKITHVSGSTPFVTARRRMRAMRQGGAALYFQPDTVMYHAYTGVGFVVDVHRSQGFADMVSAGAAPAYRLLPRVVASRLWFDAKTMRRVGRTFLRPWDWPLAVATLFGLRLLELPGMIDAIRGRPGPGGTIYR